MQQVVVLEIARSLLRPLLRASKGTQSMFVGVSLLSNGSQPSQVIFEGVLTVYVANIELIEFWDSSSRGITTADSWANGRLGLPHTIFLRQLGSSVDATKATSIGYTRLVWSESGKDA